jgi:hypothetical protein
MSKSRNHLFLSIVSIPVVLILVATFTGSPLAIVTVVAFDAFLGTVRICYERTLVGRQAEVTPLEAGTAPGAFQQAYDVVLGKRGRIRFSDRLPSVAPQHLPYVVDLWSVLTYTWMPTALLWAFTWDSMGGLGVGLLGGLVGLPLVVAKHYLLVRTWAANGRYATASPQSIRRRREFLYFAAVTSVGAMVLAADPYPTDVAVATMVFVFPKVFFDLHDAGIGPWPLTFDPSVDREADDTPIETPPATPRQRFGTEWRVIRRVSITEGIVFSLVQVGVLPTVIGVSTIALASSLQAGVVAWFVTVVVLVALWVATTLSIHWLGEANEQYRVYDDCVVAYDTFLGEPQWRVSADEITRVSRGDTRPGLQIPKILDTMPYSEYPVVIERGGDDPIEVEKLSDPEGFADAVRELGRRSIDTSTAVRTRE